MTQRVNLFILCFLFCFPLWGESADETLAPVEPSPPSPISPQYQKTSLLKQFSLFAGQGHLNMVDKTNGEVAADLSSFPHPGARFRLGRESASGSQTPFLYVELEQYRFPGAVGHKSVDESQVLAVKLGGGVRLRPWPAESFYLSPQISFLQEPYIYARSTNRLAVETLSLFEISMLGSYEIPQNSSLDWVLAFEISTPFSSHATFQTVRNGYGVGGQLEARFRVESPDSFLQIQSWFARSSYSRRFRNNSLTEATINRFLFEVGANWGKPPEEGDE